MIVTTVLEVRNSFQAMQNVGDVKLKAKAAWRTARLLTKMKGVITEYEEVQMKVFKDAGGVMGQNSISIPRPVRDEAQSDHEWASVMAAHEAVIEEVADQLKNLNEEVVEIDYDPIPMDIFGEDQEFSANDLSLLGSFITE